MDIYTILVLLFIILLGLVGIWFAYKFYKRKQKIAIQERTIPEEVLKRFNKIEQKMKGGFKEDGTTQSPYRVLWENAREGSSRRNEEAVGESIGTEQAVDNRELHEQPSRREDIQTRVTTVPIKDKPIPRTSKPNNLRRIISSIRRRKS